MFSPIHWIPECRMGRLAITARPRGGEWLEDEVRHWRTAGVGLVVSLLTREEMTELLLEDEEALCRSSGITWLSFPIPDRQVPASHDEARTLVEQISKALSDGLGVVIHCRMGIGRSGLVAASVLTRSGLGVPEAFAAISRARGLDVPDTTEQREWVVRFANSL